ncbi:MAG: PrpF family protein, partial [Chloroflexi bacterium]|nr:PrpF family protein [Chloroflexota bacterium]
DAVFLAALGSPDPSGRQLDGLGGGISSLSKVAIVGPPTRPDADVDYTFGQVEVTRASVDYRGNCGNISSAIGPFAIDEALVPAREPATVVRVHNTNTRKLIHARVPVETGAAAVRGDFVLDGVPGTGARITLDFLDPGGAVTGHLLPTGRPQDVLDVPGIGPIAASLIDATNPMVFVRAKDLDLDGTERPEDLDARAGLPARLEAIRRAAAVLMGLARTPEDAGRRSPAVPKVALVAPPTGYRTLAGLTVEPDAVDLVARIVSMGKAHRAFALTGAMCLAVAARIKGTLAHEAAAFVGAAGDVRIGHPSGVLPVAAAVARGPDGVPVAETVTVYRTARR